MHSLPSHTPHHHRPNQHGGQFHDEEPSLAGHMQE